MSAAGDLLRAARERHGVSQRQLAVRAGTSQGYVSQLERGEVSPTVEALQRLLGCLGEALVLDGRPAGRPAAAVAAAAAAASTAAVREIVDPVWDAGLDPGTMLAAFAARDADVVLVGALAAAVQGVDVVVGVVEVAPSPTPDSLQRVTLVLGDLRARMAEVRPAADGTRSLAGGATFILDTLAGRLVLAPGLTPHLTLARRASITKVDGIAVACAGRDDLVNRARPGGARPDPLLLAALTG